MVAEHERESRPGDRWRQGVRARVVPPVIVANAPSPPSALEPEMFRWRPEEEVRHPIRPARRWALEALAPGGSVLDVGVGGGAASLPMAPPAEHITGVDTSRPMLDQFEASARAADISVRAVLGPWPDVAGEVEPCDVAICFHAIYGVSEIEAFVDALTARARRRVVLEVSAHPPLCRLDPLWKQIHGIERPDWPVGDEAHAVLTAMGLAVLREDFVQPPRPQDLRPEFVAFTRRRLGVGPEYDAEIERFLRTLAPWTETYVALWWPGAA